LYICIIFARAKLDVSFLSNMIFIKLGHRYINLEMITDVFVQDRRPEQPDFHVEVYLAAPTGERSVPEAPLDVQTRHVHVSGEDAERLLRCLEEHLAEEGPLR